MIGNNISLASVPNAEANDFATLLEEILELDAVKAVRSALSGIPIASLPKEKEIAKRISALTSVDVNYPSLSGKKGEDCIILVYYYNRVLMSEGTSRFKGHSRIDKVVFEFEPIISKFLNSFSASIINDYLYYAITRANELSSFEACVTLCQDLDKKLMTGKTPLICTICDNNIHKSTMVQALIARGADVNKSLFERGFHSPFSLPLVEAVTRRHFAVVKLLVENGADVNTVIPSRCTTSILEVACEIGASFEILEYLAQLPELKINSNRALLCAIESMKRSPDEMCKVECILNAMKNKGVVLTRRELKQVWERSKRIHPLLINAGYSQIKLKEMPLVKALVANDLENIAKHLTSTFPDHLFTVKGSKNILHYVRSEQACALVVEHLVANHLFENFVNEVFKQVKWTMPTNIFLLAVHHRERIDCLKPLWKVLGPQYVKLIIAYAQGSIFHSKLISSRKDLFFICSKLREFSLRYPDLTDYSIQEITTSGDAYFRLFNTPTPGQITSKQELIKIIIANLYAHLHNPSMLMEILYFLSEEFNRYWREKYQQDFPIIPEEQYQFVFIDGVRYPAPTALFQDIKKESALQEFLIRLLQSHGFAKSKKETVGFVEISLMDKSLVDGDFIVKDRTFGLFVGKLSQMLQLAILIYAAKYQTFSMNGIMVTLKEVISSLMQLKSHNNQLLLTFMHHARMPYTISFTDHCRLSSVIMAERNLGALSSFMIYSFCKGLLNLFNELKERDEFEGLTLVELVQIFDNMDIALYFTDERLFQKMIKKKMTKCTVENYSSTFAILKKTYNENSKFVPRELEETLYKRNGVTQYCPPLFRACIKNDLERIKEALPSADLYHIMNGELHIFHFIHSQEACQLILDYADVKIGLIPYLETIFNQNHYNIFMLAKSAMREDLFSCLEPLWQQLGSEVITELLADAEITFQQESLRLQYGALFSRHEDFHATCTALRPYTYLDNQQLDTPVKDTTPVSPRR